jgi:hypothetical protein
MAWATAASFGLLADLTAKFNATSFSAKLPARIPGGILVLSWAMRAKHKLFARPQPSFDLDQDGFDHCEIPPQLVRSGVWDRWRTNPRLRMPVVTKR